jgi:hypothetical protein
MREVSSLRRGTIAGREPVAMMMRSKLRDSSAALVRVMRSVAEFVDQFGDVQQGFRGDTSTVEADAAGIGFRIDERDSHAEVSGKKCCGVSAGTGTDHCDVKVWSVSHQKPLTTEDTGEFVHPCTDNKNGCSKASAIQRRKRAASAPSISLWS